MYKCSKLDYSLLKLQVFNIEPIKDNQFQRMQYSLQGIEYNLNLDAKKYFEY